MYHDWVTIHILHIMVWFETHYMSMMTHVKWATSSRSFLCCYVCKASIAQLDIHIGLLLKYVQNLSWLAHRCSASLSNYWRPLWNNKYFEWVVWLSFNWNHDYVMFNFTTWAYTEMAPINKFHITALLKLTFKLFLDTSIYKLV